MPIAFTPEADSLEFIRPDARPEPDISDIDDADLELALKSVCWNQRDLSQFLRSIAARQ